MKTKELLKYAVKLFLTNGLAIYITILMCGILLGNILMIWETSHQIITLDMAHFTLTFAILFIIWLDKQLFALSLQYGITRDSYMIVMILLSLTIAIILTLVSSVAVLGINLLRIVPLIHFELLIINLKMGQQLWLVFWMSLLVNCVGLFLAPIITRFNVIGNLILALLLIFIYVKGLFLAVIPQTISHSIISFIQIIGQPQGTNLMQITLFFIVIILIITGCLYLMNRLRTLSSSNTILSTD